MTCRGVSRGLCGVAFDLFSQDLGNELPYSLGLVGTGEDLRRCDLAFAGKIRGKLLGGLAYGLPPEVAKRAIFLPSQS